MSQVNFNQHILKDPSSSSSNITFQHPKSIYDLKWSCDGAYLCTISGDKSVKVAQFLPSQPSDKDNNVFSSIKLIHTIPTTTHMSQVCWHPFEPTRFSFCGDDKPVEIWDVRAPRASSKISTVGNNINIIWSPNGDYIVTGNKTDHMSIIDTRTGTVVKKYHFPYEVNEIAWSENSDNLLVSTGGDGVGAVDIVSFKNDEIKVIHSISAHSSNCVNLKVDSSYRRMAIGSLDFLVSFWGLDDLICYHTCSFESEIRSICYSGDGKYLAVAPEDPLIAICNCDSGEFVTKITSRYRAGSLAWHPKANLLAFSYDDKGQSPTYLKFITFPNMN